MHNKVISIIRLFPDYEEKIDFLFKTDENFRDLCADHILCAAMVCELKKKMGQRAKDIAEYVELQQSLEEEIFQTIVKDTEHL
ncbi:hypothetical protein [Gelidibacter japonicus]|uniref:hypothetical protein n=1 Tax=Gelidibacter japonicus TaxID=1962232 RepID=UPI0013D3DE1B|nr:hypothetical protein [Gelidibacter japonicus]